MLTRRLLAGLGAAAIAMLPIAVEAGIVFLLASAGWFMAPVGPLIPLVLLVAVAVYALAMDSIKVGLFRRLHLHEL